MTETVKLEFRPIKRTRMIGAYVDGKALGTVRTDDNGNVLIEPYMPCFDKPTNQE